MAAIYSSERRKRQKIEKDKSDEENKRLREENEELRNRPKS